MNLPQDNEELRETLVVTFGQMMVLSSTYPNAGELADAAIALFQAEQTRLKAELLAKLRKSLPKKTSADELYENGLPSLAMARKALAANDIRNRLIDQLSAALDTLERGA